MAHPAFRPLRVVTLLCALAGAAGCGTAEARDTPAAARKLHVIQGLGFPESVRYDSAQDVYFISNMAGPGSLKDGNGFIVRISAADLGRPEVLIEGGRNGVALDAPKGMAIAGDTLWVADIDVLRGFHRHTGAPLASIDLRPHGAVLLNDVAVGPDGSLHVTDTGIAMTDKGVMYRGGDKVFVIGPGRRVSLLAEGKDLGRPNGITWDPAGRRWIIVSFDPFRSEVYAVQPGQNVPRGRRRARCWRAGWASLTGWSGWRTGGCSSPAGRTAACT
ncbi:SMP-30/gluconolactonase/LRE family protein [Longimicrobium sp.]|uniref:SMP-30/gluconolactonase/LRE family protein n=1 Tax=Longimicrobium sp. TaxID=2029185 RepID=UPI003B3B6FF6